MKHNPESVVIRDVKNALYLLEMTGDILWSERLASGKVKTEWGSWIQLCRAGTYDFICSFRNKDKKISILFIECKRPGVNKLRDTQTDFFNKYSGRHEDMMFMTANNVEAVKNKILSLCYDRIKDIEFNP